jgi:hypothetical protein
MACEYAIRFTFAKLRIYTQSELICEKTYKVLGLKSTSYTQNISQTL